MSHRWDWSADYSDKIIGFYQRAGRIARGVHSYASAESSPSNHHIRN